MSSNIVPGAPRPPLETLERSMIWLYGEAKIGKTSFASNFHGVWFFATEKGQDFIEVREPTDISTWKSFLDICRFIDSTKPTKFTDGAPIKTLCIDTVDSLFRMCEEHVCARLGVDSPGEVQHGGGWAALTQEFTRVMSKVRTWPYALIVLSHNRQKEFVTRGQKVDRWEPYIGAAGYRYCQAASDLIMFAHSREVAVKDATGTVTGEITEKRQLLCQPQSWAVAGGRMAHMLPTRIDLSVESLVKHLDIGDPKREVEW